MRTTNSRSFCAAEVGENQGALLHSIQQSCSGFWWNIGSAIDNLGRAFTDCPVTRLKEDGKDHICGKHPFLDYCYNRRTQFIHSRIVPVGIDGGMPFFHFQFLGTDWPHLENVPKYADWDAQFTRQQLLDDFYVKTWDELLRHLANAWWYLDHSLKEWDQDRPQPRGVEAIETTHFDRAPPTVQMGNSGYVPPSNIVLPDPPPRTVTPRIPPSGT